MYYILLKSILIYSNSIPYYSILFNSILADVKTEKAVVNVSMVSFHHIIKIYSCI